MIDVTRRTFIQGTAAAMLASVAYRPAMAAPKRGGHLRIGLAGGSSQDNVDPASVVYDTAYLTMATARNTLTNVEPNGDLSPGLAVKWEPSADVTQWTFEIRPGVTFHSGKKLELEDIIASINLHRGADSTSPAKSLLEPVTDIIADGNNKIVVKLNGPNVDFPAVLTDLRLVIVPAKDGKADRQTLDGTGPYIIESFEPGQRIRFKRNPNYWNAENSGFFDSAEVIVITDAAARMNALRSGQVDVINLADLKTLNMLKRVPGIKVEDVPSGRFYIFGMMSDSAPFTDKNVRQAVKHAINRQEMVDKILLGHGTVGNDQPLDRAQKYFDKSLPQREFDSDKAKFYLKQAGLSSLKIPLSVSEAAFPGAVAAGSLYAASAEQAGITIDVTREPDDGYFENVWMKKPFTADYWTKLASADAQFTQGYAPGSPFNETHFDNKRFNDLLVQARATLDEAKRSEMYSEMQHLIHEESGAVIPMFANYVWATKSNVAHQQELSTKGDLDGFRCIERWWFE
ncbi:ABC transporter substrate-binding protein [Rhizobium sp. BK068]|uniref:ABC transporter substrate-binding protein n=1 Tax=Rhizobium sp. BK068 TaxID=2512130 RepID=UPI001045F6FA|nr:ABC transporter substrate-binding protein [Rhizobium sp. BK068]TCM65752.1 peptide/nickel transport system substrate-binding protein [Rhizobium sp. BK068]